MSALGLGYLLSRVSMWTSSETKRLQQRPAYYNFSRLTDDLKKSSNGTLSNVFVQGSAVKYQNGLSVDGSGLDGAAKLVTTTMYTKVYNLEKEKWDDRSETIVNQCVSVPFRLSDRSHHGIIIENIHNATNFKSILNIVNQSKTHPERRTLGDHATNMILQEIPNGSLTKEYLLLYGTDFAALGDAVQTGLNGSSNIVFYPQEVSSSIRSLISSREMIAQIEHLVSVLLMVGGTIQIAIQLYFIHRRKRDINNY